MTRNREKFDECSKRIFDIVDELTPEDGVLLLTMCLCAHTASLGAMTQEQIKFFVSSFETTFRTHISIDWEGINEANNT